jgi:hypothetical protein
LYLDIVGIRNGELVEYDAEVAARLNTMSTADHEAAEALKALQSGSMSGLAASPGPLTDTAQQREERRMQEQFHGVLNTI